MLYVLTIDTTVVRTVIITFYFIPTPSAIEKFDNRKKSNQVDEWFEK
jgi:hypothetical protein